MEENDSKIWISSKDVKSKIKIKGCDLMHYRNKGKLHFIKRGNAYLYDNESVNNLLKNN